jgi:CheY-like chemotaxis protein
MNYCKGATMSNLLVVDDDQDVLDTIKTFLEPSGHAITTANCGLPALDILDSNQELDLMITDVVMPGLIGFSLARMARTRRPWLKILYLSGGGENAQVCREQGSLLGKLLNKPISALDLRREVEDALALP